MENTTPPAPPSENKEALKNSLQKIEKEERRQQVHKAANSLYWIAGMSMLNSVLNFTDGNISFAIGLAYTQLVDGVLYGIFGEHHIAALFINLIIAGSFALLGYQAYRFKDWAFKSGIALYALDGIIFLIFQGWIEVAIHGLFIYYLYQGFKNLREYHRLEQDELLF